MAPSLRREWLLAARHMALSTPFWTLSMGTRRPAMMSVMSIGPVGPSVLAWFLRLRRATLTVRSLPRSVALGQRRNSGLRSGGFFARPFHASALPPQPLQQFPAHDAETALGCRNILGRPSHTARCHPRARPPSGRHAGSGTG